MTDKWQCYYLIGLCRELAIKHYLYMVTDNRQNRLSAHLGQIPPVVLQAQRSVSYQQKIVYNPAAAAAQARRLWLLISAHCAIYPQRRGTH